MTKEQSQFPPFSGIWRIIFVRLPAICAARTGLATKIVRELGMTSNNIIPVYDAINEVTGWSASENGTNRLNEQLKYQYDPAGNKGV